VLSCSCRSSAGRECSCGTVVVGHDDGLERLKAGSHFLVQGIRKL